MDEERERFQSLIGKLQTADEESRKILVASFNPS